MGAIIRDCLGDVICSMSDQLTSCSEAEEAEAKALLRCLSNCMHGIYPTEVELIARLYFMPSMLGIKICQTSAIFTWRSIGSGEMISVFLFL
jgi:hypothetical protein